MRIRGLLLVWPLLLVGAAHAQKLQKPMEFYFTEDASTARPVVVIKDTDEATLERLAKIIQRNQRAPAERAQLAHLAMSAGRVDLGRELYGAAVAQLKRTDGLYRPILWNYGWDLLRAGDAPGALVQWATLQASRGTGASWMPPTFALALWRADRKDEAVQWYAAAVRTEPDQWISTTRYAELLPDWKDSERATLAEVHAAWLAKPPTWP